MGLRGRLRGAALRLSGSFLQQHRETASRGRASSTPQGTLDSFVLTREKRAEVAQSPLVTFKLNSLENLLFSVIMVCSRTSHDPWMNSWKMTNMHAYFLYLYTSVFLCVHLLYACIVCMTVNSLTVCSSLSLTNSSYRKALSNNCTEGTLLKYSPRRQKCPSQAPRGLQLFTSEGTLVATLGRNVTFLVFLEEVLISPKQSNSKLCYREQGRTLFLLCLVCYLYIKMLSDVAHRLENQHIK